MNKSDDIKELAIALCLAQSEFENAKKTSKNPFFNSNYASLEEVLNTVKPILNSHSISILQFPSFSGKEVYVQTVLLHTSGQWISGDAGTPVVKIPTEKQVRDLYAPIPEHNTGYPMMEALCTADAQVVGKAISYLRRYSLLSICGIAQEDDDGEGLAGRPLKEGKGLSVPEQKPLSAVNPKTYMRMIELIALKKVPEHVRNLWLAKAGVSSLDKLNAEQMDGVINMLEKE